MRTRRLAAALGSVAFIGTLCGVVLVPARSSRTSASQHQLAAGPAAEPHASPVTAASDTTATLLACSVASPSAPTPAQLPARPVPQARVYSELSEFWAAQQPIFDALPHLAKDDIHKLDYFCPADFNKDDTVDEADALAFMQAWADQSSPLFSWCDMNKDGFVDESDAQEFMRRLRESDCDPLPLTEYRPIIC